MRRDVGAVLRWWWSCVTRKGQSRCVKIADGELFPRDECLIGLRFSTVADGLRIKLRETLFY